MSKPRILVHFFGHAAFCISDSVGNNIYIDPWILTSPWNADSSIKQKNDTFIAKFPPTAILICTWIINTDNRLTVQAHGHLDHVGDTVSLLQKYQAKAYGMPELSAILHGIDSHQFIGMNKGGTVQLGGGFSATMVHALHSSSGQSEEGGQKKLIYTGEAAGWVVNSPPVCGRKRFLLFLE